MFLQEASPSPAQRFPSREIVCYIVAMCSCWQPHQGCIGYFFPWNAVRGGCDTGEAGRGMPGNKGS